MTESLERPEKVESFRESYRQMPMNGNTALYLRGKIKSFEILKSDHVGKRRYA